ncbi:MAG: hypothetical protein QOE03_5 [Micromonosporaceae bacterium]|jgi:hypothetical protein|nr:hypothetical protein [Micromonosporaceae bacterium]
MKRRTGLLAIPACVVAVAALLAAPAQAAATTFTVSPGGAWSGTRAADSTVGIRDAVSNQVTLCSGLAVAGSFKSGSGLSGTTIGAVTHIAFTGCKAEGVAVTVTVHTSNANPAPINLTGVAPSDPAVVTGQATNVSLTLDDANGCHAEVGARTLNGGGPGFTGIAYRSTDARLSFAAPGKGLFVQSATPQCNTGTAGLDVKQFDRISLGGFGDSIADSSAIISPAQRISSP